MPALAKARMVGGVNVVDVATLSTAVMPSACKRGTCAIHAALPKYNSESTTWMASLPTGKISSVCSAR